MTSSTYEGAVSERIAKEKAATAIVKAVNDLFYDKGIETVLFRNQLIDKRPSEILSLHLYARKFVGRDIRVEDSVEILNAVLDADVCPARIDIGRLASEWLQEEGKFSSKADFIDF